MAELTKAAFLSKWAAIFVPNGTRSLNAETFDEFMDDINDSCVFTDNADFTGAVTDSHTHSNKATLDSYDQSNVNLSDAVSKKHAHNQALNTTDSVVFSEVKSVVNDVNGNQVVGAQQAAIADAVESHIFSDDWDATAKAEVRSACNALGVKINAIISALEAFGPIAH